MAFAAIVCNTSTTTPTTNNLNQGEIYIYAPHGRIDNNF